MRRISPAQADAGSYNHLPSIFEKQIELQENYAFEWDGLIFPLIGWRPEPTKNRSNHLLLVKVSTIRADGLPIDKDSALRLFNSLNPAAVPTIYFDGRLGPSSQTKARAAIAAGIELLLMRMI